MGVVKELHFSLLKSILMIWQQYYLCSSQINVESRFFYFSGKIQSSSKKKIRFKWRLNLLSKIIITTKCEVIYQGRE
jgi:hypothetical protein